MFRSTRRRAFSLVEMVVALALSAIIGLMVVQALDSTSQRASDNTLSAQAQSAARETVDELTRALSAARLPLVCQGEGSLRPGSIMDPNCRNYAVPSLNNRSSVIYASERCVIFYAYTREEAADWVSTPGSLSSNAVLRTPDAVVARAANVSGMSTLLVERFPATTVGYTGVEAEALCNPNNFPGTLGGKTSVHTTFIQRPLSPSSPPQIFTFLDREGTKIPFPIVSTALSKVAIVDVNAVFDAAKVRTSETNQEGRKTFELDLSVVLSATGYHDAQAK